MDALENALFAWLSVDSRQVEPEISKAFFWLDQYIQCIYNFAMDVSFLYQGQLFVWDQEKASVNLSKHGVSFESACQVFFDPFVRVEDASGESESRDAAIGFTEDWTLLFVVHLFREETTIRIISARQATTQERRLYEEGE